MKQILLALILIAVPVAAFSAFEVAIGGRPAVVASALGDLTALEAIVTDTVAIARTGDLKGAELRVTDFETAWDAAEDRMRPLDPAAWGAVDDAADAAFRALRAPAPKAETVNASLAGLLAVLDHPTQAAGPEGGVTSVAGIAVTDQAGHPLACEDMLNTLRAELAQGAYPQGDVSAATALQAKATERCNADDDAHADAFSAQALALAAH